ncbi:MAG: DUF1343 domain-containing protein [Candidatus Riflebacteria bacterium]|nr:DUF1343 domain-containing protein [Candidatus Riflebacteria bacterium]
MFKPGLETFFESDFKSCPLKVAAVTNNTGRDRNGIHLIQRLLNDKRFILKKIFTPEHGFLSDAPDGEYVSNSIEKSSGAEIISLYNESKIPSDNVLKEIDLIIYDIQDVGVRFYTYISTLRNIIDSASKNGIAVAILDRPELLGGINVEGPMLNQNLTSFVGHLPIALRYGLTAGELALFWRNQTKIETEVRVYKCQNYSCPMSIRATKFPWFKPSPSMTDIETAKFYPGTCLFEGTNLSEGRGTLSPFRNLGAPWVDNIKWYEILRTLLPSNITISKVEFIPTFSKYSGILCKGIQLSTNDDFLDNSVYIGVSALYALIQSHPNKIEFTTNPRLENPFIDYLSGTSELRMGLQNNLTPSQIISSFGVQTDKFRELRKSFFLYERSNTK